MERVIELDHPLVKHHLTILRDEGTNCPLFRQQVRRLAALLAAAATTDLPLKDKSIRTPITDMTGSELAVRIAIVPILRAGLGLVEPIQELLPEAEVWHVGMFRDELTAQPIEYYCKLPPHGACEVGFVLDPMLATGGSVMSVIAALEAWGCPDIRVLSILAARAGIERLLKAYPQIRVFVCGIDPHLNENNFIVPGLGDAGDRIFNTFPREA